MVEQSMVEAVAQAISETPVGTPENRSSLRFVVTQGAQLMGLKWDEASFNRDVAQLACAAIEAMRIPTRAMENAWWGLDDDQGGPVAAWQAMLSAALPVQPEKVG